MRAACSAEVRAIERQRVRIVQAVGWHARHANRTRTKAPLQERRLFPKRVNHVAPWGFDLFLVEDAAARN
eukprot:CAMPEP_0117597356 /NCGR_PEP_ID=MMETSP0784-20121206/74812_1 /TAXON_ID=39447 /ORGANISM="" /LENGTH=69 /DNA_ID=CAMNT_0005399719 /DNA_START=65 /DNA_END=274 /DNA_ORIENTATION=+